MTLTLIPEIGTTGYCTFIEDFKKLDGIYTINQIVRYADILDQGINLFQNLFEPLELPESRYNYLLPRILNNIFLKLEYSNDLLKNLDTADVKTYWAPQYIFSNEINRDVVKVGNMIMLTSLGLKRSDYDTVCLLEDIQTVLSSYTRESDIRVNFAMNNIVYMLKSEFKNFYENEEEQGVSLIERYNTLKISNDNALETIKKLENILEAENITVDQSFLKDEISEDDI